MSNIKLKTDLTTIKNLRESGKRLAFVIKKVGEAHYERVLNPLKPTFYRLKQKHI